MSRAALTLLAVAASAILSAPAAASGPNPHIDLRTVLTGCGGCHRGHGAQRSPMLAAPQRDVCLSCHGSRAGLDQLILRNVVAADAKPAFLSTVLALPFGHPMTPQAFSALEPGAITCTSCHSPHRAMPQLASPGTPSGRKRPSPRDPIQFEYELCESCHGNLGATTQSRLDISRLFSSTSRSFHPVETPSFERSPSVPASLSGREINCTDCHGNDDPGGPRGPHGSTVRYILVARYTSTDGAPESATTYALCYRCHDRESILTRSPFPEHRRHIVEVMGSCATCHDGHGSVRNRALIRFGEETNLAGVSPSASGKLAFESSAPGSGSCYLTCHGKNHDPLSYGIAAPLAVPLIRR